ncbi:MAG TPA: hypothetical protein VJV78_29160 [Polyangiales bacterium]|nr:hypothetical protein [Polyangiales bacterium]
MISGQDGPRPVKIAWGLGVWLVAVLIGVAAVARAEPKWRLVLLQPQDGELVTRVEGQTRDLGVRVDVIASGWEGDAEQAQKIATQRGADFVARIVRGGGGALEVQVYAVKLRGLRQRAVPRGKGEKLGGSAELEAAALVLRGELSALMHEEGDEGGESVAGVGGVAGGVAAGSGGSQQRRTGESEGSREEREGAHSDEDADADNDKDTDEDKDEDEDEDEDDDEDSDSDADQPVENFSARTGVWTARLGGRGSLPIDGEGAFGLVVGGRAQAVEWLEIGLAFSTSLPLDLGDQNVRIRLFRQSLTAEALGVVPWGPRLRVLFGVASGVVLYARNTDNVAAGYVASGGDGAWSATLGLLAELQWVFARHWGMGLGAGLDLIPLRTRFTYEAMANPDQKTEIATLRGLEPWGTLCLFGLFGD